MTLLESDSHQSFGHLLNKFAAKRRREGIPPFLANKVLPDNQISNFVIAQLLIDVMTHIF